MKDALKQDDDAPKQDDATVVYSVTYREFIEKDLQTENPSTALKLFHPCLQKQRFKLNYMDGVSLMCFSVENALKGCLLRL